jgi:myosin heavy subunit
VSHIIRVTYQQLNQLIATTDPHYIRCLKPNDSSVPNSFNVEAIANQLHCNGVLEAVKCARSSFSHKIRYKDFLLQYSFLTRTVECRRWAASIIEESTVGSRHDVGCITTILSILSYAILNESGLHMKAYSMKSMNEKLLQHGVQVEKQYTYLLNGRIYLQPIITHTPYIVK